MSTNLEAGFASPPLDERTLRGRRLRSRMRRVVRLTFAAAIVAGLLALVVVGGTAFRVWQVARTTDLTSADAIVVLGAAQYDGVPTPVFEARLEQALKLYRAGVAPTIITVGGRQPGDVFTEASAGRNYLASSGVPGENLLPVETGSDTLQSMRAVHNAMLDRGMRTAVLVSDPWHSLRARTMARDVGIEAWAAPTRQGPAVFTRESQFNAVTRETGALLWYRLHHLSTVFT